MQTECEPAGHRSELRILETNGKPRGFRWQHTPGQRAALHDHRRYAGRIQRRERTHCARYLGAVRDVFETWIGFQRHRYHDGPGAAEKLHAEFIRAASPGLDDRSGENTPAGVERAI